jgi:hypothetical protein
VWLKNVKDRLSKFADESEQRRLWLSTGEGGAEVSSLIELCCGLYDDCGINLMWEEGRIAISEEIDVKLRKPGSMLDQMEDIMGADPEVQIIDPRMAEVRELSGEILQDITAYEKNNIIDEPY